MARYYTVVVCLSDKTTIEHTVAATSKIAANKEVLSLYKRVKTIHSNN